MWTYLYRNFQNERTYIKLHYVSHYKIENFADLRIDYFLLWF